jgi:hypothetical protein
MYTRHNDIDNTGQLFVLCRKGCLDGEIGGVQEAKAGDGTPTVWPIPDSS